jgi:hypothetical protein
VFITTTIWTTLIDFEHEMQSHVMVKVYGTHIYHYHIHYNGLLKCASGEAVCIQ